MTKVRKVVSTTTHMMENDEPVVEVTISPFEMRENKQTTRTTTTKTTSRTTHDSSLDESVLEREPRSPRSPNGYLIEEEVTTTSQTSTGKGRRSMEYCSFYVVFFITDLYFDRSCKHNVGE